jgi:hypothetical protein
MNSTGQSGNVLSSHYRDWTDRWVNVQYVMIGQERRAAVAATFDTLVLAPAQANPSTGTPPAATHGEAHAERAMQPAATALKPEGAR